jgi:acetyltransferase-like isoleucine patch superfamily enzyme
MTSLDRDWYLHPLGHCDSSQIGSGTRIWAFTHVLPEARIGSDGNICDFVFIENDVVLGDRVTVKSHVSLWDGLRVEDDVFIGPGVQFANDKTPRSKRHLTSYPVTMLRCGASIGAGAVILPGVEIGTYAMVGAGAVVSRNVPPFTLVLGVPAREAGLVCICGATLIPDPRGFLCPGCHWRGAAPSVDMRCEE